MSIETERQPADIHQRGPAGARWPALAAGLLAGLSAWMSGELSGVYRVTIPARLIGNIGAASAEQVRFKAAAEDRGSTFAFTVLGSALGLALGGAGGLARGSSAAALKAGALGAVAGAGAGFGIAGALAAVSSLPGTDLRRRPCTHAAPRRPLGSHWRRGRPGVRVGPAWPERARPSPPRRPRGRPAGRMRFEVVGVLTMTTSGTTQPLPTTAIARLLAMLTLVLSVAAGASWADPAPKRPGLLGELRRNPPPGIRPSCPRRVRRV